MSLRKSLVERVAKFGVEDRPLQGRDDGFSSLYYNGKEFAHFHHDNEIDARLTRALIDRERLVHPPNSVRHPKRNPKSPWIELRFETERELDRVVYLLKLTVDSL